MHDEKINTNRFLHACNSLQFGSPDGSGIGLLSVNDVYGKLRENKKRTNDDGNQENYHHLDLKFVKDKVDPSQYDQMTEKSCDYYEFDISPV